MIKTQTFFEAVFGWSFESYGPEYLSFKSETMEGGFLKSKLVSRASSGNVLIVFYSTKLEESLEKVVANGGVISESIFSFPGGGRGAAFIFMTQLGMNLLFGVSKLKLSKVKNSAGHWP